MTDKTAAQTTEKPIAPTTARRERARIRDKKLSVFFAELDAGASLLRAAAVADINQHFARSAAESMGYCNIKRRLPDAYP